MAEKPILFNGDMVRAILDGRKTQTRRVVKPQLGNGSSPECEWLDCNVEPEKQRFGVRGSFGEWASPFGGPGDTLWVREAFAFNGNRNAEEYRAKPAIWPPEKRGELVGPFVWYRATDEGMHDQQLLAGKWRPSIHMPRWASRINLTVTDIRVERVQEISRDDALSEGCDGGTGPGYDFALLGFKRLWNSINEPSGFGWDVNPWVWVVKWEANDA